MRAMSKPSLPEGPLSFTSRGRWDGSGRNFWHIADGRGTWNFPIADVFTDSLTRDRKHRPALLAVSECVLLWRLRGDVS
jgi:hypothetical protein